MKGDLAMRTIVHVGPHKTGTTSIQQALADNYEHLLENGVVYPVTGRDTRRNHHELIRAAHRGEWETFSRLRDEVEGYGTVVISTETLGRLSLQRDMLCAILEALPGDKEILFCRRDPAALARSLEAELIKQGKAPRDYYPLAMEQEERVAWFAGAGVPVTQMTFEGGDLELRFFRHVGVAPRTLPARQNKRLPRWRLDVMRRTNRLPWPLAPAFRRLLR